MKKTILFLLFFSFAVVTNAQSKKETAVANAVEALFGETIEADKIQLQQTKKEFEGDITVVTFPFVKLARKSPEETGRAIGEWLLNNQKESSEINIIKRNRQSIETIKLKMIAE